jgi:hypothetical protein
MLGFVGDVGDLAKLAEGAREATGSPDALGHELADCLWAARADVRPAVTPAAETTCERINGFTTAY